MVTRRKQSVKTQALTLEFTGYLSLAGTVPERIGPGVFSLRTGGQSAYGNSINS
ncbi:hypothetical protein [Pseudomonas batumici]|uniref:Uncharacterized protein n=1 Tax=Pseudomonas batumici TaxID=226910 RepID=A0A0C2I426_9PSED|nr:hypothetical protein [Pseudomonas batumici]KIH81700.1 hypothetical protein UCMB321_4363 [Pseudomonas batumici]